MLCFTCVRSVCAEQWAWESAFFFWWRGCPNLAKTKGYEVAVITDKQDGPPYLKIWLIWVEKDCYQGSVTSMPSQFFHQLARKMVILHSKSERHIRSRPKWHFGRGWRLLNATIISCCDEGNSTDIKIRNSWNHYVFWRLSSIWRCADFCATENSISI